MSFAVALAIMLLGSSVVIALVLQPSDEEPAASAVSRHRCHGESLQAIRESLLGGLNLQAEPQVPAGHLDAVRQQWQRAFSAVPRTPVDTAVSGGNGASCCSVASEIFMKDLGWHNWVIHPASLTIVHCAICNRETNTVQCAPSHANFQNADPQAPCCQPNAQEMVPVVYVDESNAVVISSVRLTRGCGCGPGKE